MAWISIEERLPPLKEKKHVWASDNVLAFDGENMFVACRWKFKPSQYKPEPEEYFKSTICACCNSEIGRITHWMPLPSRPS